MGRELVMFLAEYLLANYPSQTRVAQLLNTTDVWLMPRYFLFKFHLQLRKYSKTPIRSKNTLSIKDYSELTESN